MKILVINTVTLRRNGITSCIMNYVKNMLEDDMQIDILVGGIVSDDIRAEIEARNIKLYVVSDRRGDKKQYLSDVKKVLSKNKYDVVHVHGNSCTMAGELFVAKLAGCKVRIAHSHNTTCVHMRQHKLLRPLFELCCNRRLACGQAAGEWLFRRKNFTVLKNGVKVEDYTLDENIRNEIRNKYGIKSDELLIGHIGLFVHQKNHEFLIELAKHLRDEGKKQFRFVLIGEGPLREPIENAIREAALEEFFCLTGAIHNVSEYLQAMDLLVLPSRYEGLPYVLVEAQALALQCVVSDQVSKEADITESIAFCGIENPKSWVDYISGCNVKDLWEQRYSNIERNHHLLSQNGYDINENVKLLKEIYTK